jgi:hypothetical protein
VAEAKFGFKIQLVIVKRPVETLKAHVCKSGNGSPPEENKAFSRLMLIQNKLHSICYQSESLTH